MSRKRFKDDDPFDDVIIIWREERAIKIARMLWPNKGWVENVNLLELMGDGEIIVNGDPFSKSGVNI